MIFTMMGMRVVLVAMILISASAIKVPVQRIDQNDTEVESNIERSSQRPIYYESDEDKVDSYLVPPNPHRPAEVISDDVATPATYLLPPSVDKQLNYYKPIESGEQTDWYPIAPAANTLPRGLLPPRQTEDIPIITIENQSDAIFGNFRTGKVLNTGRVIPVPSRSLQPPAEDAHSEYVAIVTDEGENNQYENERAPAPPAGYPLTVWNGPIISVPNNIRAKPIVQIPYNPKKYKNPTKLYPKKYGTSFKAVPIPLAQFADDTLIGIPKAKPIKPFKPYQSNEPDYITPSQGHKYDDAQQKHRLKGEVQAVKVEVPEIAEVSEDVSEPEQETSASNYRTPLRNVYPTPLRQASPPAHPAPVNNAQSHKPPADGERTEFRMHGMKGPHSYQFGFDTGKGKNRQFRYEERDNDGHVKGHYGYVDKHGKLRVVNYDAGPQHGFRAEAPVESE